MVSYYYAFKNIDLYISVYITSSKKEKKKKNASVITRFVPRAKWMDNDPMSQKTMSLLESGLETEHSMS